MFEKILIAENFSNDNFAVKKIVEELNVSHIDQANYCDDAISKIRKSFSDNLPYELLITDLSFDSIQEHIITSGEELIKVVKEEFPDLKIIVFSIENRQPVINSFFEKYNIDAFITRGADCSQELKKAIENVYENKIYLYTNKSQKGGLFEFTNNDLELVRLLSVGMNVPEISVKFKTDKVYPNSESYLNKRLVSIRQHAGAATTLHLLTLFSDWNLI
ncbi:DNA-binding response regulator, NarL/FixJ family, contains REC and HTH domains [Apibacter mensalis]|uniref:DNA-binding response regulator, NarL/FixJ family, contains REC and HTH domains n=1 Tax=Apibacter mensalis TaxID=1586267 RepID=A0A0X3ARQ6_9FLAO|nr:response regulator [Apibacter mensalis]CVK17081.1 DNA-binding response regulator, NarL/FixJ family, contains REC and HTH domains [Apibacter mensalis]